MKRKLLNGLTYGFYGITAIFFTLAFIKIVTGVNLTDIKPNHLRTVSITDKGKRAYKSQSKSSVSTDGVLTIKSMEIKDARTDQHKKVVFVRYQFTANRDSVKSNTVFVRDFEIKQNSHVLKTGMMNEHSPEADMDALNHSVLPLKAGQTVDGLAVYELSDNATVALSSLINKDEVVLSASLNTEGV